MKKLVTVFSILFLFILVSCETDEAVPDLQASIESSDEVDFNELFQIEKGVLAFKDKESFNKLNKHIFATDNNLKQLVSYLEKRSFDNLYSYYKSIGEEDLSEVFKTHKVSGELSKYFVLIPDAEGDFDLEETVKETFLQLYFNRSFSFKIGDEYLKITNDQLILEKPTGEVSVLESTSKVNSSKSNSSKLRKPAFTSNYTTYKMGGRKFKLKVDTDTRWGSVSIFDIDGYKQFWNFIQYQAIHRRRWAGVYYNTNTQNLRVYGNHYWANPTPNSNSYNVSWTNFDSYVYNDTDKVTVPWERVHSYNVTAWSIDFDGGEHFVSASETN